jgi:hypothetical protein
MGGDNRRGYSAPPFPGPLGMGCVLTGGDFVRLRYSHMIRSDPTWHPIPRPLRHCRCEHALDSYGSSRIIIPLGNARGGGGRAIVAAIDNESQQDFP